MGKGTTFHIYFPAIEEEESEDIITKKITPISPESITILLADDDDVVRTAMSSFLSQVGYKVFYAKNGQEAINIFENNRDRINLLILDVVMPDKNGFEALKIIREIKKDIRAILISGYSVHVVKSFQLINEEIQFLQKPISSSKLIETINKTFWEQE